MAYTMGHAPRSIHWLHLCHADGWEEGESERAREGGSWIWIWWPMLRLTGHLWGSMGPQEPCTWLFMRVNALHHTMASGSGRSLSVLIVLKCGSLLAL